MKTPLSVAALALAWSQCIGSQATQPHSHRSQTQRHTTLWKKTGSNKRGPSADATTLVDRAASDTQSNSTR